MTDADTLFMGLGIGLFIATVAVMAYKTVMSRLKINNFYYNHVVAYKVGLIKDRAEKEKIVLVFPPDADDLIDSIKDEVSGDLDSKDVM